MYISIFYIKVNIDSLSNSPPSLSNSPPSLSNSIQALQDIKHKSPGLTAIVAFHRG